MALSDTYARAAGAAGESFRQRAEARIAVTAQYILSTETPGLRTAWATTALMDTADMLRKMLWWIASDPNATTADADTPTGDTAMEGIISSLVDHFAGVGA